MTIVYSIAATHSPGGMERVLANKANELVRRGHQVIILTTDQQHKPAYFKMDTEIRCFDLAINYVEERGKSLFVKTLNYLNKQRVHKARLKDLLLKIRADIVVSMFDHDATFLYSIRDGSRKVLEVHFSRFKRIQYSRRGVWGIADRWRSRQDVRLAERYDRFVVLTEEDKRYWGNVSGIAVIPNANSFVSPRQAPLTAKRVIAVGRYDYQKGFDELIEVWSHVHKQYPDWRLDIFGRGPLRNELQRQIEVLHLDEVVSLREPVFQIENEYLTSSILAMTSRYEGLPMVLLEAQVCGLPLVAYACKCGPKDIIRNGENGFLLEEYDKEGMASKLMLLMENSELRIQMGEASKNRSKIYEKDCIMEQWIRLFDGLNREGEDRGNG